MHRRQFLSSTAFTGFGLGLGGEAPHPPTNAMPQTFNILDYGAVPDGKTLNTQKIQAAIDDASKKGGGVVYIPAGTFMTGGLVLRSHITLHLASAARLLGSPNAKDYEHADIKGRHLIFARGCENIEISGMGTIDGNGAAFYARKHTPDPAPDKLWRYVIAMDYEAFPDRPSPTVELAYCTNVRIKDVTLANPAGWTLRPICCKSVFITGVMLRGPVYAPQTDGIDITCSENVFISNCDIAAGDDAIVLKSLNPYDSKVLPTRNITITNCVLTTSSNGFKMGTETHGVYENIVFTNSVIYNDEVPVHYRVIAGIAIETVDGGSIDGVHVSNIRMKNVRTPIFIRLGHRTPNPATFVRNISISDIDAVGAVLTSSITGMQDAHVESVALSDIRIRTREGGQADWGRPEVPEVADHYPEARMFSRLPCYGLYVRHVSNLRLRNVEIVSDEKDLRPAIVCDDVKDLVISGFETSCPAPMDAILELKNCQDVSIQGSRAPKETKVFARILGPATHGIVLTGNDLTRAKISTVSNEGASADQVSIR